MAEVQDLDSEVVGEIEAVEQQIEAEDKQAEPAPEQQPEDDIPEEFRNLTPVELARKLKHSYREMGRMGNELGEIRKLADELIKSQLQPKKEAEQPKPVDFFENPEEAIKRAVETNPAVVQAQQFALQARQMQAKQQLQQLHPDFQQIVQDEEFAKWVGASPVRQNLLRAADAYDVTAANELLSTFKELRQVKQQRQQQVVTEAEKQQRDKAMRAAAVDTGGSGESTKKIYRRADLIRMQIQDRSRYEAMQDEIMLAYQEGRVR